jgi:hypothetical protein
VDLPMMFKNVPRLVQIVAAVQHVLDALINCVTAHGAPGAAEKARPFSVLAGPAIILLLPVSDRNR